MIKNLVNLANYLDNNGLRAEADYLDSLIEDNLKKEARWLRDYAKHSALNLGQVLRHLRYLTDLPDTPRVEAMRQRLRWIANDLYYTITPGQWHHTQAELDELSNFTYAELLRMGFDPDFADKIDKKASLNEEAEKELNLDDNWLKEVGIDRDAEEKSLQEEEPEESFEEKIPDSLDKVHTRDRMAVNSDIPKLKEANLIPVHADGKTLIGRGYFGRVYNVIWKGKPAVAKVGTKSDAEAWSAILRVKERIPAEYHKHIPQIYEVIKKDSYSIIVMKKLLPMSKRLVRDWSTGREEGEGVSQTIADFERLYGRQSLIEHLDYHIGYLLPKGWERSISIPTIEKIKDALKDKDPLPTLSDLKKSFPGLHASSYRQELVSEKINYWITGLKKAFESANSDFINTKEEWEKERIYLTLESYVRQFIGHYVPHNLSRSFPDNPRDKDDRALPPEFQSFHNFLLELNKLNIAWSDLGRGDNTMIDPDTKEIVLTDVGNFIL